MKLTRKKGYIIITNDNGTSFHFNQKYPEGDYFSGFDVGIEIENDSDELRGIANNLNCLADIMDMDPDVMVENFEDDNESVWKISIPNEVMNTLISKYFGP